MTSARDLCDLAYRTTVTTAGNININTNTLFVDNVNNLVGIGTTSPAAKLDIVGNIIDGVDVTAMPMWKRAKNGIGYLPQESSIFRKLSVWDNVMAVVETLNLSSRETQARTAQQLTDLGLERLARQPAYTLSGGERRRLEIARALATNPRFLLMDEPFSGVDPISVAEVQSIIRRLKEKGIGVLITDHNVRETLSIVDRAYLIHQGQVLVSGTAQDIVNNPESRRYYLGEGFKL